MTDTLLARLDAIEAKGYGHNPRCETWSKPHLPEQCTCGVTDLLALIASVRVAVEIADSERERFKAGTVGRRVADEIADETVARILEPLGKVTE